MIPDLDHRVAKNLVDSVLRSNLTLDVVVQGPNENRQREGSREEGMRGHERAESKETANQGRAQRNQQTDELILDLSTPPHFVLAVRKICLKKRITLRHDDLSERRSVDSPHITRA